MHVPSDPAEDEPVAAQALIDSLPFLHLNLAYSRRQNDQRQQTSFLRPATIKSASHFLTPTPHFVTLRSRATLATLIEMSALQRKILRRNAADAAADAADALARRKREEDEDAGRSPWSAGAWKKATEDILNGTWKSHPPIRHPVLLTPDGPISSASKLQKLAETESLPEVTVTIQVELDGQEIQKVAICDVSTAEWKKMKEKADVSPGIVEGIRVMFKGKRRFAGVVHSLKEGVTLGDEDGDEEGSVPGPKAANTVTGPPEPPTRCHRRN